MKKYRQTALIFSLLMGAVSGSFAQTADEEISNSSSKTYMGNEYVNGKQVRQMDSLYANDVVLTRDVTIPANGNKLVKMADKISAGALVKIGVSLLKQGSYEWQILDQAGRIIKNGVAEINAETKFIELQMPPMIAGSYQLMLINKSENRRIKENFSVI